MNFLKSFQNQQPTLQDTLKSLVESAIGDSQALTINSSAFAQLVRYTVNIESSADLCEAILTDLEAHWDDSLSVLKLVVLLYSCIVISPEKFGKAAKSFVFEIQTLNLICFPKRTNDRLLPLIHKLANKLYLFLINRGELNEIKELNVDKVMPKNIESLKKQQNSNEKPKGEKQQIKPKPAANTSSVGANPCYRTCQTD